MSTLGRKIHTMFHTPRIFMKKFASTPLFRLLPDELALKIQFRNIFLKKLDLANPKTFNEKLQWLKLYNRRPEYTTMVDKYAAKAYVAAIIGEEHIIPTLGVYDRFEDIDFDALPDCFVLKCTHGSGDVVICRDKKIFKKEEARKKLTKALKTDFYKIGREWPYKNVKPRIIAEQYMIETLGSTSLTDYKFYCFDGFIGLLCVIKNRHHAAKTTFSYFDENLNKVDLLQEGEEAADTCCLPNCIQKMRELATKLSSGLSHARIDFYESEGKVFFGEITFFNAGGFSAFHPAEWDEKLGEMIVLPKKYVGGK